MPTINFNNPTSCFIINEAVALNSQRFNGSVIQRLCVSLCFTLIGVVSAFDMYFVEANPDILNAEQNPVCLALMRLEPDSKVYFFIAKTIGSLSVLLTLWYLLKIGYQHAKTVLVSVAVFQLVLLCYLCLGDARIGGCPNFTMLFQDTPESIFPIESMTTKAVELKNKRAARKN